MLNAAREEEKKQQTNHRQTESSQLMLLPCVFSNVFCRQIQCLCSFFQRLMFGQMLVENRAEAGVLYWECVFVFVCVWEANVVLQ